MSRSEAFVPPSLAQHFEPPDEHVGCFGWVCGYSADAPFLNDAAERFTRQTLGQRAYAGRISLALLLDPSGAQIPPTAAPGVTHLPLRPARGSSACSMPSSPCLRSVMRLRRRPGSSG